MAVTVPLSLLARADDAARSVGGLPPQAAVAREMRRVRRAEIFASTVLAGSQLGPGDDDALLDHGIAQGGHPFADYVLVRAYADATELVSAARAYPAGDPRPLASVDELRQLNTRATAGSPARGGAWRQSNYPARAGIVAPAAWLVAREVTTLVDRAGRGPRDQPVALWIARFMGRFARLSPFEDANGRTLRLGANLLLRRLDYPPLVYEQRDRARFPSALARAETNDPVPLGELVARAILRTCNRLSAAAQAEPVLPLREAAGEDYPALAKAAQRGRLRTIVRGFRYYTTGSWIAEYRAQNPTALLATRPTALLATRPSAPAEPPAPRRRL
jgi:hypothetical protein